MQFTTVASLFFASLAAAVPTAEMAERQAPYVPCSGLYGTAQCCATDVLGVADLDCGNPPETPSDADKFSGICSDIGQRARCCVLPILEQGVLCNTPAGVDE